MLALQNSDPMSNHYFGFTSVKQYLISLFGNPETYNVKTLLLSVFGLGTVSTFLEQYIWSPLGTLMFLTSIIVCDFAAAVACNAKIEGFMTKKAARLPLVVLSYWVILAIAFNLSRINASLGVKEIPDEVFSFFSKSLYWFCLYVNVVSLLKHLTILKLLPKPITDFFTKWVDTHKNRLESVSMEKLDEKNDDTVAEVKEEVEKV